MLAVFELAGPCRCGRDGASGIRMQRAAAERQRAAARGAVAPQVGAAHLHVAAVDADGAASVCAAKGQVVQAALGDGNVASDDA